MERKLGYIENFQSRFILLFNIVLSVTDSNIVDENDCPTFQYLIYSCNLFSDLPFLRPHRALTYDDTFFISLTFMRS